jgi:DNA repair protein RecO
MQSWTTEAIVLKRVSVGEADRVITLLTPGSGKITCIAKGIRKMTSSQRAYLEPGNYVSTHLRGTSSLPILTQTRLVNQFPHTKKHLKRVKQLFEVLELADLLFVESSEDPEGFQVIQEILELLNEEKDHFHQVQALLNTLLTHLGYQDLQETQYRSIIEYATSVAERPIRSYEFLSVQSKHMVK